MRYSSFFSKQARKPSGLFGRLFMGPMFVKGNQRLNSFVKENLKIQGSERMLEIGFGPGLLLNSIAEELDGGTIEGIDFSGTMVSMARKRNKKHIQSGKVLIRLGDFNEMNFEKEMYDSIFSVNTIYFWKEPDRTLAKISASLKPGGKLVLGFHVRDVMIKMGLDENVFQFYTQQEVVDCLEADGYFKAVEIVSKNEREKTGFCAIALK